MGLKKGVTARAKLTIIVILTFSFFINYYVNILISRWLGPAVYGKYTVITQLIFLLASIILLGSNISALKYIPEYLSTHNERSLHGLIKSIMLYLLAILLLVLCMEGIIFFLAYILNFIPINTLLSKGPILTFIWLAPLFAIMLFLSSVTRSFRHYIISVLPSEILRLIFLLLLLYFITIEIANLTLNTVLLAFGFSLFAVVNLQIYLLYTSEMKKIIQVEPTYHRQQWLLTSLQMMIANLFYPLISVIDFLLLNFMVKDHRLVGIFAAIITLINIYWIYKKAITILVSPYIAPYVVVRNIYQLRVISNRINRFLWILTVLTTLALIIFRDSLLLTFGTDFTAGGTALIIFALSAGLQLITTMPEVLLQYSGHQDALVTLNAIGLALHVILALLLIPYLGILGLAWAALAARLFLAITSAWTVKARLHMNSLSLQMLK